MIKGQKRKRKKADTMVYKLTHKTRIMYIRKEPMITTTITDDKACSNEIANIIR